MAHNSQKQTHARPFKLSFEFFPPKSADMEAQLWETVDDLAGWEPEFVSVTYLSLIHI